MSSQESDKPIRAPVRLTLMDEGVGHFDVSVLSCADPSCVVLFAVGSGGNPDRYLELLTTLATAGCMVVAPHFERLLWKEPEDNAMLVWARRLRLALGAAARPDLPVAGVGHSIGATLLVALAGGQMWTQSRQQLPIEPCPRIDRLVLLAPATDWFLAPGALDAVRTPIIVWVGAKDEMTPVAQAKFLQDTLEPRVSVDLRIVADAGHYSFMNVLPPGVVDSLPDRTGLLVKIAEATRFIPRA